MSVRLPCGCQDTKMCAAHEAAWWARHAEALKHQAETQGYSPRGQAETNNLDLVGGVTTVK
jgi:hypothetical protein